jgi:hypothetical protein
MTDQHDADRGANWFGEESEGKEKMLEGTDTQPSMARDDALAASVASISRDMFRLRHRRQPTSPRSTLIFDFAFLVVPFCQWVFRVNPHTTPTRVI